MNIEQPATLWSPILYCRTVTSKHCFLFFSSLWLVLKSSQHWSVQLLWMFVALVLLCNDILFWGPSPFFGGRENPPDFCYSRKNIIWWVWLWSLGMICTSCLCLSHVFACVDSNEELQQKMPVFSCSVLMIVTSGCVPSSLVVWGPIHRHYPKICLKTCHKIILWQKLRCHKMS